MPLSSLICASIDTSMNQLLALDSRSEQRKAALIGRTIRLEINELKQPLFFHFTKGNVEVLGQYEGEVSAQLTLNFNALLALKNNGNLSDLIKDEQLVIEGDIKTLQAFADLLTKLDIDWQEHLSHYIGDVMAYRTGQGVKKLGQAITKHAKRTKNNVSDYLTHESDLLVGQLEFVHFSDQVDELTKALEHITAQINALKEQA